MFELNNTLNNIDVEEVSEEFADAFIMEAEAAKETDLNDEDES